MIFEGVHEFEFLSVFIPGSSLDGRGTGGSSYNQQLVLVVLSVVQAVLLIWSHVIIYGEKPTFNLLLNT